MSFFYLFLSKLCRKESKCLDGQDWANSGDPYQTQNAASDRGLHCLPLIQQFNAQHSG